MTQQHDELGQGQSGQPGQHRNPKRREPQADKGAGQGSRENRPKSRTRRQSEQDQRETPEHWLEENSLGNPTETGNTITGENEY